MSNPIAPDVVYKLRGVGDPSLSPDGTRLAYSKSWVEEQSLESRSRIMMMDLATGQSQEFTQGIKDGAPKFSPSGGLLCFLRSNDQGRRQVWLMAANGGEARRLTTDPGAVADFAWSPRGDRIVYSADVDPDPPKEPEKESIPSVTVVKRIRYRYDTLGWRGDSHFHLFVTDTDGSGVQPLTSGDWDDLAPAWSPDGSQIAFISGRRDDRDLQALTELYVVPAEGGDPVLWSEGLSGVGAIAWSPDGQRLVVAASEEPGGLVVWQSWLYILEPGKPPKRLSDDSVKPNVGFPPINPAPELRWTKDGRILFLGERRGESFLYEIPDTGGASSPLTGGGSQISALALDAQATQGVVLSSSPSSPGDLHRIDLASHGSSQLTDLNQDYLSQNPPALMEKFGFQRGGLDIECRLWRPPEFDAAKQYPLVLDVHGGPNGAFYDSFASVQQVLATAGYLVLAVNPRG
ncbi:MAG: S9 family peptidase, partial [Chloroflexi bacterium]|nr:S9 family peptidase [Chloroflexota bacterium]